jgi:hypothetical protein
MYPGDEVSGVTTAIITSSGHGRSRSGIGTPLATWLSRSTMTVTLRSRLRNRLACRNRLIWPHPGA